MTTALERCRVCSKVKKFGKFVELTMDETCILFNAICDGTITMTYTECPECGVQFVADLKDFYPDNPDELWTINTMPYKGAHYAVFPPKLAIKMIMCGSAPGHVVLDPFSGSGTTLYVARKLGRKAVGYELSPKYCDLIRKRNCQSVLAY